MFFFSLFGFSNRGDFKGIARVIWSRVIWGQMVVNRHLDRQTGPALKKRNVLLWMGTTTKHVSDNKSLLSVKVYAKFRIFSLLYLAIRQAFPMGNWSTYDLCSLQSQSHPADKNRTREVLVLPRPVSLYVLLCDSLLTTLVFCKVKLWFLSMKSTGEK